MDFQRKKMACQVREMDAFCVCPELHTSHRLQTWLVKVSLILSISIGSALVCLVRQCGNEKPVQALKLQGYPSVFVICIIFSFTGSFSWLLMRDNPKHATFRRCYFIMSTVFMASALSILASALFFGNFMLVSPGNRLWNPENLWLVPRGSRLWNSEIFRLVFRNWWQHRKYPSGLISTN